MHATFGWVTDTRILKKDKIHIYYREQYLHETKTWERTLDFYQQENAHLKMRLSQVVDGNSDKHFVELAEHFQNSFLYKDQLILDLLHRTQDMHKLILKSGTEPDQEKDKLNNQQLSLRKEINNLDMDFTRLKNKFNQYLDSFL